MSQRNPSSAVEGPPSQPLLPVILLLFVGSGCAALIYEIVWFQMLELVIGSSGVSIGVLLGTFMGGMFLGSLTLARFVGPERHPLRVYAVLEAGIGISGLALLVLIPLVGGVYSSVVGHGFASILLRGLVCSLLLLPPTVLMGATLPAISRWVETTPRGISWMGFFYGGNIAGAVVGALLAGFYLLRVHDLPTATFVAVALNATVAGLAFFVARFAARPAAEGRADAPDPSSGVESATVPPTRGPRLVYVAIALSGLTALGAQVVWTRLLSLLLGATVYTFSIILGVFLTGLGIGSGIGSYLSRVLRRPRLALGACQLLLVGAIAWSAYALTRSLPFWPVNPSITPDPWYLFQIDLARTIWAIFPATLLWGASFPLAVAAAAARGQDPGRLMGGVYAANTVGAIVGALAFGIVLIPWIGTQGAHQLLVVLGGVSGLLLLAPGWLRAFGRSARPLVPAAGLAGSAVAAVLLAWRVPDVPPVLVAYGRYAATYDPPNALYVGEGRNASVAVTELANGVRNFHVSGKVEASTEPQDMRLQRMLGHISGLMHDEPRSVLVVGFGAGVTAGAFVTHPTVERIVICEIEPLIPGVVSRYFTEANHAILSDPRVEVVYDDARHYILTTDETFDVITSDPIHPWVKGAASLYTKEYFELAKAHLNPGGVVTQWVPLYESSEEVVRSEFATFFEVFPEGTVWGNDINGRGYDVVIVGKADPTPIDVGGLEWRLQSPSHRYVRESLREVGFRSAFDLLSTYAGRGPDLQAWLEGAAINRDRDLRLMYIAGLRANLYLQDQIYSSILEHRRFPEDLFTGQEEFRAVLRSQLGSAP